MNCVRKIKWWILPILLLCINCTESKKTTNVAVTQIEWISDSLCDFGMVKEGETVIHFFCLRNIGNSDFLIEKVETGCGCISVDYPKKSIKKGDEIKIEISFNSSGRYGKQYKEIRIFANLSTRVLDIGFTADVR